MIGFIKNLFSSILSFFVGLFGGKKSLENKPSTTSAEKLAADTAKTGNRILSSFTGLLGDKKSQENKPSTTSSAEKPAADTAKTRKRSGYFMELDEAEEMKPVETNQSVNGAAKTPQPAAAKTTEEKPTKTPQPTAAKSAKEESAKTPEATATAQSAKVELVQTAKGVTAVPAKREKSPVASANGQTPTETTFAPKYLAPTSTSNSRRRPGPSMNPFLDMARQVKNPG